MLMPRKKTPELEVDMVGGGHFSLAAEKSERGIVICFYRGLHCPICAKYLTELEKLTPDFAERGVTTIAISSDDGERAQVMADKIEAKNLRFGYNLPLDVPIVDPAQKIRRRITRNLSLISDGCCIRT